jgi:teichuronic acid biosynthesis glycosyltransferase TuaG
LTDDVISVWKKNSYDDTIWWLLIMKKGVKAYLVPDDLALYRLSENQLSSNRLRTIKNVYLLYNYFPEINFFQKNIYFLMYIFDSSIRHFKLKLLPKKIK